MTKEWINKTIKEHHKMMVEKGFYDCPECEGRSFIYVSYPKSSDINNCEERDCKKCNGTGKDQNKNTGELLMLIVSELGEALEAHRCGQFADWQSHEITLRAVDDHLRKKETIDSIKTASFESCIKDSFEDEICDVFLSLFDLCGYLVEEENYDIVVKRATIQAGRIQSENIAEWKFIFTTTYLKEIYLSVNKDIIPAGTIGEAISELLHFCNKQNIPIQKHIEAKMAYNKIK